jgi:Type VI secretion, TssG
MEKWETWKELLELGAEDLRPEVVVGELLIAGALREDELFFQRNGGTFRSVARDIERVLPPGTTEHKTARGLVELNRAGIYDGLPEGLFHQSKRSKPFRSIEEIKEEYRSNEEIEKSARKFFWPLDHELSWARVMIELNERRLTTDLLDDRSGRGVLRFWDPPDFFSEDEKGDLLMLLPLCYRLVGNLKLTAQAMEEVLQVKVELEQRIVARPLKAAAPENGNTVADGAALSEMQLGVDSLLDGAAETLELAMIVRVGPMDAQLANTFAQGQVGRKKLDHLLSLLLRADQFAEVEVRVKPAPAGARLATERGYCRLGVTSILN